MFNDNLQDQNEVLTAKAFYFLKDVQSRWWYFLVKPFFLKWFGREYRDSRGRYLKTYFRQDIVQRIKKHNA